ncbi:uncharacterized protein LOC117230327 isoform X2 [Bombus vosnesenskii]|uniref:Uncharacterized protein LOC117230327 isoform X2 n=1 Tax=Bombus vosnesenskii TaxID=207650 RepID=A0A6J3JTT4_9HYME|nr:uncharacterized protein LOC117230327 isoform X2 [Bombus vosnesenskii]
MKRAIGNERDEIVFVSMVVVVAAYKKGRRYSALEEFPPYQETGWHPSSSRGQHHSFREPSFKTQYYQSYRHRPYRQDLDSFPEQLSLKDRLLLRDYELLRNRLFYDNSSSFKNAPDFHRQSSIFMNGTPFRNQQNKDQTVSGNEQRPEYQDDRYSSYRQPFRDDFRFADLYDKPVDFYKGQSGQQQVDSVGRDSEYLKHGNHGLGYVSVPPISPYGNALPLSEEASTTMTPSMAPTTTHKPWQLSTVSSATSATTQVHTSTTSELKMDSHSNTVTMPTVKSDTLADAATTSVSASTISTIPASMVTTKQSSNLARLPTTEASLPVMDTESPIISFGRQTVPPIVFQPTTFTSPTPYYLSNELKDKFQQSVLDYLLSQQEKDGIKSNVQILPLNQALPDTSNNSLNNKIPSMVLNYILPENSKGVLKNNLQSSLLSYLLQQESNHGLPFQQSSLSETANHVPLTTIVERPTMTLPSIPIATLSAVSRPVQTINYIPITPPRVSAFLPQDSSTSSGLSLGTPLSSGLSANILSNHIGSTFNSLPGGINTDISAGISNSLSSNVPTGVSTLNFGENVQYGGQLRPFEPARTHSYSTGLQLQLGGFGGIDYTLRSTSPTLRSTNLDIGKLGLSLPELPRYQLPAFSKVKLGQRLW